MDPPDGKRAKSSQDPGGAVSLDVRDRLYIRRTSLEEAIVLAFQRRIDWGPSLSPVWYHTSTHSPMPRVPEASDVRVRRIASILRALRYDSITRERAFGMDGFGSAGALYYHNMMSERKLERGYAASLGEGRAPSPEGMAQYNELVRHELYRKLVADPVNWDRNADRERQFLDVKDYLVGRPGTPLMEIDHRQLGKASRDRTGLVHVLAFMYESFPATPWIRHPYLLDTGAIAELGLYNPAYTIPPESIPDFVEQNIARLGLTSIHVLQEALNHHFQIDVSREDDPFWIAGLVLIADAYIRGSLIPTEAHILLDSPRTDAAHDVVVPQTLQALRLQGMRPYHDYSGVGGFYPHLIANLRHEAIAIRKREGDKITDPPNEFMYPYGDLLDRSPANLDKMYGLTSFPTGIVDPVLLIRDLLTMSAASTDRTAPVASMLYYKAKWALLYNVGRRIVERETRNTMPTMQAPSHVMDRWVRGERDEGMRNRAWIIAMVVVIIAMRSMGDGHDNRMFASKQYFRGVVQFMEHILPEEDKVTQYLPYYYPYYVLFNTQQPMGAFPIFWGSVAYIAMFIYDSERNAGVRLLGMDKVKFDQAFSRTFLS